MGGYGSNLFYPLLANGESGTVMAQQLYESDIEWTRHRDTIDYLAKESGLPVWEIGQIYETELQRLKAEARVKDFLPVLIIRIVKDTIRRKHPH